MSKKDYTAALCLFAEAGIDVKSDYPLSEVSSFRIGGPADLFIRPATQDELVKTLEILKREEIKYYICGRISDLVFSDRGFRGAVISTVRMKGISVSGTRITAACGEAMSTVAAAARDASLSGFEFAYGIPGSIGGGVFMNAGAYGGQIADVFESAKVLDMTDGRIFTVGKGEADFAYRHSFMSAHPEYAVLEAVFSLTPGNIADIGAKMDDLLGRRHDRQPLEYPSAGSTFKRPAENIYVGKLIEDAGLKGSTVGGACVSEKHAGFIINKGGATAEDVKTLVGYITDKIYALNGINLECEIKFIPENI